MDALLIGAVVVQFIGSVVACWALGAHGRQGGRAT